ncbi:MAG: hypothetical protein NE334_20200 [Lentisphaeraceae bacterium]|nr:hypothetical protein [Lentisphaeraceae bacterium]
MLVSESVIWWNGLGESGWTSNHSEGTRGTNWTQLKFSPIGYNQFEKDGSAKWRRISSLNMNQPKAKISGYWQYWRED